MRYVTGEDVRVGDIVHEHVGFPLDHVDMVIYPGTTAAEDFCLPKGGVSIHDGTLLVEYNGPGWSDIIFVSRGMQLKKE